MAERILLKNVKEISSLIELIKKDYANDYRRIWSLEDRTIAVLLHETIGVIAQYTFTIMTILDFSPKESQCEVFIQYVGGDMSFLGTGKSEDFVKVMKRSIESLARKKMWKFEVVPVKIRSAGTPCPHCKKAYKYPKEKIEADGTVKCQNCGKPFVIEAYE
jgi:predicted Zn finger-like uncharacterized protein